MLVAAQMPSFRDTCLHFYLAHLYIPISWHNIQYMNV